MKTSRQIHRDIKTITDHQWNQLLQYPTATFFCTKEALQFFYSIGIETYFFALERDGEIQILISGIIQKEKGIKSTLTSRAIIYGGPVIGDSATETDIISLCTEVINYLKKKAIYIESRNFNDYTPFKEVLQKVGFDYVPHLNFHLDCSDESQMKKRMSSSKMRQVKKSLKEGAKIIEAKDSEQIIIFYNILQELYRTKVKTPLPDLSFFAKMWKERVAKFFLITYQTEIIGGIVCPVFGSHTIYEWFVCGKDRMYKNIYPSVLATWAAMDYAVKHNIRRFDFMGAGKPDEAYGVRDFKSKFGGTLVEHGRFLYVAQPMLYKIGKTAVKILKST